MTYPFDNMADYIEKGLVRVSRHPTADLYIYNYTQLAQYSSELKTDATLRQCRGLICDGDGNIVARGFTKFFNLGEQPDVDKSYMGQFFTVEEKVDGSLGILYWDGADWAIATRGSFTSDQAIAATKILHTKYRGWLNTITKDMVVTYLFEIVYPENRIVVNYGNTSDLILLGKVFKSDGFDFPIHASNEAWPGPIRATYGRFSHANAVKDALGPENEGKEGFVLRYDDGHRVKVKLDEYIRLHKVLTNCTEHTVWEAVVNNTLADLVELVPDEFHDWVKVTACNIAEQWAKIHTDVASEFYAANDKSTNRKEFAQAVKGSKYSSILFKMYDGNHDTVITLIYKMIEPSKEKTSPFLPKD